MKRGRNLDEGRNRWYRSAEAELRKLSDCQLNVLKRMANDEYSRRNRFHCYHWPRGTEWVCVVKLLLDEGRGTKEAFWTNVLEEHQATHHPEGEVEFDATEAQFDRLLASYGRGAYDQPEEIRLSDLPDPSKIDSMTGALRHLNGNYYFQLHDG